MISFSLCISYGLGDILLLSREEIRTPVLVPCFDLNEPIAHLNSTNELQYFLEDFELLRSQEIPATPDGLNF